MLTRGKIVKRVCAGIIGLACCVGVGKAAASTYEFVSQIVQDPKVLELMEYATWEEGFQHLVDTWPDLQELLRRPDALEAVLQAYKNPMSPGEADTAEDKVRLVFLELLLQRQEVTQHDSNHERHIEGIEERYTRYLDGKMWDKYMVGYEDKYFAYLPERGVRQDQIPYFYSACPAMAYRVAVAKGYRATRERYALPPGRVEDMSTWALVQIVAHSPDSVKIWNNYYLGEMYGTIRTNWYDAVRAIDPTRELMMFREDAAREILRYYQSIHLTDENHGQLTNPLTVCEIFLRQELVSSKLTPEELAARDRAFADKFIEKLRYRREYSRHLIPQWIAYEDMDRPLQLRKFSLHISEFRAMPVLAGYVLERALPFLQAY